LFKCWLISKYGTQSIEHSFTLSSRTRTPSMAPPLEKVGSNYIPEDISFSILSKLSIKSLNRFSCVRNSWNQLFENSNFINLFRNNLIHSTMEMMRVSF
jgi:hypothetical protein